MSFDKKLFAELLEKAKGERSINKYASEIDISPAHISRLLRQMLDTPPSPETIRKFAGKAYNEVSYDQLMRAAGHINKNVIFHESGAGKTEHFEKYLMQFIISELYGSNKEWSIHKTKDEYTSFYIELKEAEYSKWQLKIGDFSHIDRVYGAYGEISLFEFLPSTKLTLVATSKQEFNNILQHPPKSLRVNLFAMQLDITNKKIIREEKLCEFR